MDQLLAILGKYWGYDSFRPLQAEAMSSVLAGRDSVVVLPTGGGKSLCFQAPALAMNGLAVVVSPLISLMKDQVDALIDCGVPAACVNSSLSVGERRRVADEIKAGSLKLLYLSPEKLMTERTLEFLKGTPVSFFAIDEAHCISDWGHDFRPEYRMLSRLKEAFPTIGVHAYTATATERVRSDIARELRLVQPEMLVGSFDRPNLTYRVQRRTDLLQQVREVIDRHPDDGGIIYCIRRADVDNLCASLKEVKITALPYHAGLDDDTRRRNQEEFITDRVKIMVATVAFGMGIDKSNVRFVIHAGAPKSLEHYQQESGRAGRDGLEAECVLLYSGNDFSTWRRLQSDLPPVAYKIALEMLAGIESYCTATSCRHRALVEYFGQTYAGATCDACDACLEELQFVPDSLVIAQKILSSVVRQGQAFGVGYTTKVLAGSRDQRILENGHERLSTYGLLAQAGRRNVREWIEQLVHQGFLRKTGEFNVLSVTEAGRKVLRGDTAPQLMQPVEHVSSETKFSEASWEGVDRGLFEQLRRWRRKRADERGVPPFVVFSDATLRNLARCRPSSATNLLKVPGIGEKKASEYGEEVLRNIVEYCGKGNVPMDVLETRARRDRPSPSAAGSAGTGSAAKRQARELLLQKRPLDEIGQAVSRAHSTVVQYLVELITQEQINDVSPWLHADLFQRIEAAAQQHGLEQLKPLHEALAGEATYDELRIAVTYLRTRLPSA